MQVSNKFLLRDDGSKRNQDKEENRGDARDKLGKGEGRNTFGWSKKNVPTSRSGRIIKGRGVFVSILKIKVNLHFMDHVKFKTHLYKSSQTAISL